ncbi:hypothetical protein N5D63_06065 [Comamonas thiooxydans]|uniref:Uncharacterized protein n=1 Tax=Comamonas thiooxydans TaxID=363952 RepID=A0AA42Q0Q9_9BURK|nr:hypothetical protein [Comamonas thiooxydans]MDH1333711.1 hypothetical protein [Comamonas thiooxydans]MDH1739217.1 hypothetical protein [Comamonas thiooxydans]
MSQNTSPDNVPSAKQGTADSMAAPGRVGAGGTIDLPIQQYLDWLFAQLARLENAVADPWSSNHPDADQYLLEEAQAALRVYMRFVDHRLGRA